MVSKVGDKRIISENLREIIVICSCKGIFARILFYLYNIN